MKLFPLFSLASGWRPERKFVDTKLCLDKRPVNVENGEYVCDENKCSVKCDKGYDLYGRPKTVRCKQFSQFEKFPKPKIDWNKQTGVCKTCDAMQLKDDNRFDVQCDFAEKLGQNISRCTVRCLSGAKIRIGDEIQKESLVTKCKCSRGDSAGKCHWKMGSEYLDTNSAKSFSKWHCGEVMPENLTCPSSEWNANRKTLDFSADRLVGGSLVARNTWPWVARLRITTQTGARLCGGTIISKKVYKWGLKFRP